MPSTGSKIPPRFSIALAASTLALLFSFPPPDAQSTGNHPWSNANLSPDERASMVVKEMTLDEKISLLHGTGMAGLSPLSPEIIHSNGGARIRRRRCVPRQSVTSPAFKCQTPPMAFA